MSDDKFALAKDWLDQYAVRGCFGVEHGNRRNQKHLQGAAEVRAPDPEDKGHLLVSKSIRLALRIVGKGYKATAKYFTKTQSPSVMVGYCMKDSRQGWFRFVCKGLSKRDLAKVKQDYTSVKQSYARANIC